MSKQDPSSVFPSTAYAWSSRAQTAAADRAWAGLGGPAEQAEGDQSAAKGTTVSKNKTRH